jgi:hypothetical protein
LSATDEPISFERDIKPLFREGDRQAMKWAFDLWSYDDVAGNSSHPGAPPRGHDALRRRLARRSDRRLSSLDRGGRPRLERGSFGGEGDSLLPQPNWTQRRHPQRGI